MLGLVVIGLGWVFRVQERLLGIPVGRFALFVLDVYFYYALLSSHLMDIP